MNEKKVMIQAKDDVIQKNEFPFDIFNGSGRKSQLSEANIRVHNHDCLEINYVIRGGSYNLIGGEKLSFRNAGSGLYQHTLSGKHNTWTDGENSPYERKLFFKYFS